MSHSSTVRLLVVEDDEDDFFLLESNLKETALEKHIVWASSFDDAKKILHTHAFDLAVIDYRLGIHTGIELAMYIRDNFPFLPTILLTGLKASTIDEEALRSGVYDYLAKDEYSPESIDRSIRYEIEKSRVLRSLKESENKFKNLFENSAEYVFLVDPGMNIIDANKSALKLFDAAQKEKLVGRKITEFITHEPGHSYEAGNVSQEVEFVITELSKKRSCIMNISVADSEKGIYQWVLLDITERLLNEQKEKMLEKQAITGKFARVIAHEIKNPLTNIHLSIHELRSILQDIVEGNKQNGNEPIEFLAIIERNSQRINTLIEDLLNATRFDTMHLQPVQVHELVEESISHISDRARLKDILIVKDVPHGMTINADREKMVIALNNLLVNAVEAMNAKEGKLEIRAMINEKCVDLSISDNGKGIPEEDLPKLFEPFFTSKKGGTGLGLTATYAIVTKHDGSINVSSEKGKGTCFTLSVPYAGK